MSRKNSPPSRYWKFQTKLVWHPAAIEAMRGDDCVAVRVYPSRRAADKPPPPAGIILSPQEAIGFAAWLHEQAEHVVAKQARAAARKKATI